MTWFERLMGFSEGSPHQVRSNITVDGVHLTSNVSGATFVCGHLETPTLADLRERAGSANSNSAPTTVREVIADVQHLHIDQSNSGAMFQVASQFNLLEMVGPSVTPERGVGIYENDHTQGPACAIAAGAGTIYRNYFAEIDGTIGQSATRQIDCLADIGNALGNADGHLWEMRNGYALASAAGLNEITQHLQSADDEAREKLRERLRIGVQWDVQVTLDDCHHLVSQAYCSALPVAYSNQAPSQWADFATLILEASYEATLCASIVNANRTGNHTVYLTLLGGGAFGNETRWIIKSMRRAIARYPQSGLDVAIVSRGRSNPQIQELVTQS